MQWPITGGYVDQAKLDATTEEEIERQAIEDGTDQLDWSDAVVMPPLPKEPISIRVDQDLLDWFRSQGKGYQTRINAVLRRHMEAQRRKVRAGRGRTN
jgi:uncharacterized protein (DUF4415 family)